MTTNDGLSGELRLKQRERKILAIKGGLFAVGMVSGGIVGWLTAKSDFSAEATWPPSLSIALVVTYLTAIALGSYLMRELCDEVERQLQYKSIAFAGLVYVLAYPVWFTLWKGTLLPEPSHWMLFAGFYLSLAGAYLYYRFR